MNDFHSIAIILISKLKPISSELDSITCQLNSQILYKLIIHSSTQIINEGISKTIDTFNGHNIFSYLTISDDFLF